MAPARTSTFCVLGLALWIVPLLDLGAGEVDASIADVASITMLEEAWASDRKAKQAADETFLELKQRGHVNLDAAYAYLLVKIRQNDIKKAMVTADWLLEVAPEHLGAHHARCWLLLLTKKTSEGLSALKNFARVNRENPSLDAALRLTNLGSIGRMVGYLQGPMSRRLTTSDLRFAITDILEDATEEQVDLFERERKSVVDAYERLVAEKQSADEQVHAKKREQQEKGLNELAEKMDLLEEEKASLKPRREKVSEAGENAISSIRQRAAPLKTEYSYLNQEAASLQIQMSRLIGDARHYEHLAIHEPDPVIRESYLCRADQAGDSARRISTSLAQLDQQIGSVARSLKAADHEFMMTQRKYNTELNSIDRNLHEVAAEQRKTQGKKKRVSRPVRTVSARGTSLKNRARGISTYERFPVERERDRLLKLIKDRS